MALHLGDIVEDLLEEAAAAEDVASAFFPFLSRIHEYSAEISAVISELFGISSAFRDLAKSLEFRVSYTRLNLILDDIELSLYKVYVTLSSVEYQFERLGITPDPYTAATFARVWREIQLTLRDGSTTFLDKLRLFKDFLLGLVDMLKGVPPEYDMRLLRQQLLDIRVRPASDISMDEAFGNLSLGYAGLPDPRQAEPRRPLRRARRVPGRQQRRYPFLNDDHRYPPAETPDPLAMSPVTTVSSSSSDSRQHWALSVFDGRYPVTPFSTHGLASRCVGKQTDDAEYTLSRTFQRVSELELEDGAFIVYLYWNPRDHRATILCASGYHRRDPLEKTQSSSPLSLLEVSRQETCLQLSHVSQSRSARTVWARLRFRCYERMALFFCTIVALRAQGPPDVPMKPSDYRLEGEVVLGEYKIHDDDFLHILRILKDRDSGGVRLEAAVFSGELKDTPVWTAFITDHIKSRSWMRRTTPRVIQLPGLHPYVFSNDYSHTQRRQGQFELSFYKSEDAWGFMEALRSLRARPR